MEALLESGEFDPFWYDDAYPDVRLSGLGPVEHYLLIGKRLGRAGTAESASKRGVASPFLAPTRTPSRIVEAR
jgi:hypothetical protein